MLSLKQEIFPLLTGDGWGHRILPDLLTRLLGLWRTLCGASQLALRANISQ